MDIVQTPAMSVTANSQTIADKQTLTRDSAWESATVFDVRSTRHYW